MRGGFDLAGEGGRTVLITGGAGGLGRGLAEVFAAAGDRVMLADLDGDRTAEVAAKVAAEGQGAEVESFAADVGDPEQAAAAVRAASERWDGLHVVINNAGISGRGAPVDELDPAELERVLAVNLRGPFHVCGAAVSEMRRRGGGVILNVASITAQLGSSDYAPYAASKAGVVALTRGLARRVGRYNIRVNCLNPGSIDGTGLMAEERRGLARETRAKQRLATMHRIPLGRAAQPHDVAHTALFLASPFARHVHGTILTIDGGESLGYQ